MSIVTSYILDNCSLADAIVSANKCEQQPGFIH